ncbi:hypothetical protein ACFC00_20655 [Streptomyces adustus]|uniref:hypothetical protein n=1 Tax=Streptomyces adustus TaxID=1609272 RepID=UPI0035DBF130
MSDDGRNITEEHAAWRDDLLFRPAQRRDFHECPTGLPAPRQRNKAITDLRLCAAVVDRVAFGGNIAETGDASRSLATTRAGRQASAG